MTNNHVVVAVDTEPPGSASTMVRFNDGRTARFDVIAADRKSDITVIRAQRLSGLTPILMGSSADLRVGHPVAAVGSPLGLQDTVTSGVISALNRPVLTFADTDDQFAAFDAIQTDATLNPGSSGGALVDMNGKLIEMSSAIAALDGLRDSAITQNASIGLGFAIPVDHALRVASELMSTGRASHAWLGVQTNNDQNPNGARIIGVVSGSSRPPRDFLLARW